MEYRSKKELEGDVRITSFPGADSCACCGTHVTSSGQVGMVKFLSAKSFRSPLSIVLMMGLLAVFDPVFDDMTFRWIVTITGALLFLALLDWLISRFAPWLIGKKKGGRADRWLFL